jgi:hypothetical protein
MNSRTVAIRIVLAAVIALAATHVHASLVAGWNFNTYNGNDTTIAADHGSGTLSIASGFTLNNPTGTTVNEVSGDVAGTALSLFHGDSTFDMTFSMTGLAGATLSWATKVDDVMQGHENNTLSYSLNGGAFTTIESAISGITTSFALATYNLPAALNGITSVRLRYTLSGSQGNHGTTMDNIQINSVPEANGLWLGSVICGIAGLGYGGRRLGRKAVVVAES